MSHLIGQHETFSHFHRQDPDELKFQNLPGSFWSTLSPEKKITGTLHDLYTIPEFHSVVDIMAFVQNMQSEQVNQAKMKNPQETSEAYKEKLEKDLVFAFKKTREHLESEWFFLTSKIKNAKVDSFRSFLIFYNGIYKQSLTNTSARISLCVFLKELTTFFKIIRYPDFQMNDKTGEIDLKNDEFVNNITQFFSDKPFKAQNGEKFTEDSPYMIGTAHIDGREIIFQAVFGVKSPESLAEKIDSQEKYNIIDAVQDLHRMRIEVRNEEDAMRMGKAIFEHFGKNFEVKNAGEMLSEANVTSYSNQFLQSSQEYEEALKKSIDIKDTKKVTSADRKELKLVRSAAKGPALEIQIVLLNNKNEIGFAHHDIYRIKRKIARIIRLQWYINQKEMKGVIKRIFAENFQKNQKQTIPFSEEKVLEHILEQKDFLMEIREQWKQRQKNHFYTTPEQIGKWKNNYDDSKLKVEGVIENINMKTWQTINNMDFK